MDTLVAQLHRQFRDYTISLYHQGWLSAVKGLCVTFKECCDSQNYEGCVRCLQQVDIEYKSLKAKLQDLFNLEQQIVQAGGRIPQVDI